eukprot:Gb_27932 [translate_table: standard]
MISRRQIFNFGCVLVKIVFIGRILAKVAWGDDSRFDLAGVNCSSHRHINPLAFEENFVDVMESLSHQNDLRRFGTHNEGNDSDSIYGLFQCMDGLSHTDCSLCFSAARTQLPDKCVHFNGGRIYLEGCFLRFENSSFYNHSVDAGDTRVCGDTKSVHTQSFWETTRNLINEISVQTLEKDGFSAVSTEGPSGKIYAFAQCWKTLSKALCKECILNASAKILSCPPSLEGRAMNAGCYMRYSTQPFSLDETSDPASSKSEGSNRSKLLIILGTIAAAIVVALGVTFWKYKVISSFNQNEAPYKSDEPSAVTFNSKLNFKYKTLEIATRHFDSANKLGQGGFGSVYKGVLPEGREIAVKKLFFNGGQGVGQFLNEVNLISRVEHKNLVKLLGCSVKGLERLLVYEYLPNKSLDQFLFGFVSSTSSLDFNYRPSSDKVLDWQKRFDIILGTAAGLAYLHEETEKCIIHRDIKASNILLDQNLKPKIADFGLARGYMAPEYVVRGQLTEKADVFSFGVLVLEIVSGKRNNDILSGEGTQSLLDVMWRTYESGMISDAIDPNIKENYRKEEALRVLQVALLCTQASSTLRPTMSEVIQMLANKEFNLPAPTQPPFLELQKTFLPQAQFGASTFNGPVSFNDVTMSALGPR